MALCVFLGTIGSALGNNPFIKSGVAITPQEKSISIHIDGKLLTEYHFMDVDRPFFWPVLGPDQAVLTRGYPVKAEPNDAKDHPHHAGLWFTHGEVNGNDFWHKTKIVHKELVEYTSGTKMGQFTVKNAWLDAKGKAVCWDTRTFSVFKTGSSDRLFEYKITIHANHGDVVFGDTKEGSMAIRLAPTMRVDGKVGKGHIENSEGVKDGATWGKRAAWVDYYGPVNDAIYGVTIMDHPENPRHPTWWHVRTYGLFAANPFGIHNFEKKSKGTGDFKIEKGSSKTFKYGFLLHKGKTDQKKISKIYKSWTSQ